MYTVIVLMMARAWAAPAYTQALARARSPQEIERLQGAYQRLKIAQTACQIEMNERRAPVSCYEAVELESVGKSAFKAARFARLDSLCARAANALRLSELTPFVTKTCARNLREAREILHYRDEEDAAWSSY